MGGVLPFARLLLAAALVAGCGADTISSPTAAAEPTPGAQTTAGSTAGRSSPRPSPTVDYRKAPRGPQRPTGRTTTARVTRIVDGDTIHVDIGGKDYALRYIGMDAPESVKPGTPVEPFAREATKRNTELVGGRTVVLERDVSEADRYGRLLRDVWLKAGSTYVLVDFELVLRGYARVTTFPPDVKYVDDLLAAERWARDHSVGLWGLPDTVPPAAPSP